MLSIEDIKNVSFRRANFGGYKPEDVDAFIDDIQISYEEMMREREDLLKRINKFHEEDNSIRKIILNAQKIAEKALEDAKVKTTDMISKAVEKSEKMIKDAKKEVSLHMEISERLKSESAKLKKQLEDIYKKHIEIIDKIPSDISVIKKEKTLDSTNIISNEKDSPESYRVSETTRLMGKEEEEISGGTEQSSQDIFSTAKIESINSKFENLKFGENYQKEENKPKGVYFGIFRNKK